LSAYALFHAFSWAGLYVAPTERMFNENQRYTPKQ
jgi:hypothetical protein